MTRTHAAGCPRGEALWADWTGRDPHEHRCTCRDHSFMPDDDDTLRCEYCGALNATPGPCRGRM